VEINIDIVADVVCPWCFIGKRRLESALNGFELEQPARLFWRPFELNPELPRSGVPRKSYLEHKFGSGKRIQEIQARVTAAGTKEGIIFNYGSMTRMPNTLDAHRLLWMADRGTVQNALAEALFNAFFVEGLDIGSHAVLVALGERVGIEPAVTAKFLASEDGVNEVRREQWIAHELGVNAVPYFIINGRYGFSGAQDCETISSILARVIQESEPPQSIFRTSAVSADAQR
jgi:predicted DsbA family dithiol-disulfide isomerase